jgi:hypothetical protein
MTDNISTNMQKATLIELYTDKLLDMSPSILKEDILYSKTISGTVIPVIPEDSYGGKTKLGELTVFQAIDYISKLMSYLKGD